MGNKPRKGGFAYVSREMLEVWRHMPDEQRAVLPILLSYLPDIHPSYKTIATRVGKSGKSVKRAVKGLAATGLLSIERRKDKNGEDESNRYHLANVADEAVRRAIINRLRGAIGDPLGERVMGTPPWGTSAGGGRESQTAPQAEGTGDPRSSTSASITREGIQGKEREGGVAPQPPRSPSSAGAVGGSSGDESSSPAAGYTPEVKAWGRASPENMRLLIRFGREAYNKTPEECERLPAGKFDFLAFKPSDHDYPYDSAWTFEHFVGFYWDGVCRWRADKGMLLAFPNMTRLFAKMGELLQQYPPRQAYCTLWIVINYFDLIRFRIGNAGRSMVLDEGTFTHGLVAPQAMALLSMSREQIQAELDRMADVQYARDEAA